MKIPIFLRNLLQSNNYWNKNSVEFEKANEYLEKLFPGELRQDATGQYIEPEYDMTYEQFLTAQKKLDDDIEQAIQEAQGGKEDNNTDYTQFIETEEEIDVRVLMPWGDIQNEKLIVYTLSVPDDSDTEPEGSQTVWVWCGVHDELLCPICRKIIGKIFTNETDIPKFPIHPNCRCWIEERELDNNGKSISSKAYKGQKPDNKTETSKDTENFDQAYNNLKEREGGYTTGKNQKKDEPTNMGIKQSTLDKYSAKYPDKNFPRDVKDLNEHQAKEIYKSEYWDNTRIPQIENNRIRNAIFDMNVMGGAGKVVQRAINSFSDANLKVDGVIGKETLKAINAIPDTKIEEFMSTIKSERINYLQNTQNWETAKNGWIKRTNAY